MSAPRGRLGDTNPRRAVVVLGHQVAMPRRAVMVVFRPRLAPRARRASAPLSRRCLAGGVSGGQGVSHYGGQGEPPLRGGCARVPRSKCPQPPVKGTWSETQVDDQGGSVLPAIMAHFLSAIDTLSWIDLDGGASRVTGCSPIFRPGSRGVRLIDR
jgi:hypothetical protein